MLPVPGPWKWTAKETAEGDTLQVSKSELQAPSSQHPTGCSSTERTAQLLLWFGQTVVLTTGHPLLPEVEREQK